MTDPASRFTLSTVSVVGYCIYLRLASVDPLGTLDSWFVVGALRFMLPPRTFLWDQIWIQVSSL